MIVACPSCQTPFEADDALAGGPGVPLCDACSNAVRAPSLRASTPDADVELPAPPTLEPSVPHDEHDEPALRRRRPRAPQVSFAPRRADEEEPRVAASTSGAPPTQAFDTGQERLSLGEIELESSGGPDLLDGGFARSPLPTSVFPPGPGPQIRRSDYTSDTEPVSLHDLEVVLGPIPAPPPWSPATSEAHPGSASPPVEAKPAQAKPVELRTTELKKVKPSFFQVDSIAPPSVDVPIVLSEPPRSSGHEDLRMLLASTEGRLARRPSADLSTLRGGLFGEAPQRPAALPLDLSQLLESEAAPPRAAISPSLPAPPSPRAPAPRPPARSTAPGPVVSERRPVVHAAVRRSGIASWAVAVASVSAVAIVVLLRFGATTPPDPVAKEGATSLPVATPPALPAGALPPSAAAPPAVPSEVPATTPSVGVRGPAPRAPVTMGETPKPPAQPVEPARVPIERPPAETKPPVEARPAPAEGAEFDRGAARAALATAASAAAGCKQGADEPAGAGRVTVTFAPSGRVIAARVVGSPFQGTRTGGCIAATFRSASVPPFAGDPVVVTKDVVVR